MVTNGIKVGEYRPLDSEREIDIRVRFPKSERTIDQLDRLTVNTFRGQVPVSSFVDSKPVPETTTINRKDGKRSYQVTGEKVPGRVTSEDIFDGGRNALVQTIDSELDNKVQRLRVDLPGLTPELINN